MTYATIYLTIGITYATQHLVWPSEDTREWFEETFSDPIFHSDENRRSLMAMLFVMMAPLWPVFLFEDAVRGWSRR